MTSSRFTMLLGFVFALSIAGAGHLFALADEITSVSASDNSVTVDLTGTKPVFSTDSFTSGGGNYFLLSLFHSVLLGSPHQYFVVPNQSASVTAAQFTDAPYVVHILLHNRRSASYHVSTRHRASGGYVVSLDYRDRSRLGT